MNAQELVENLTSGETNRLIGALAWRIDEYGIITAEDFHKAFQGALECE